MISCILIAYLVFLCSVASSDAHGAEWNKVLPQPPEADAKAAYRIRLQQQAERFNFSNPKDWVEMLSEFLQSTLNGSKTNQYGNYQGGGGYPYNNNLLGGQVSGQFNVSAGSNQGTQLGNTNQGYPSNQFGNQNVYPNSNQGNPTGNLYQGGQTNSGFQTSNQYGSCNPYPCNNQYGNSQTNSNQFGNQGKGSSQYGNQVQGSNQYGNQGQGSSQYGNQVQGSNQYGNQGQGPSQYGNQVQGSNQFGNQGQGSSQNLNQNAYPYQPNQFGNQGQGYQNQYGSNSSSQFGSSNQFGNQGAPYSNQYGNNQNYTYGTSGYPQQPNQYGNNGPNSNLYANNQNNFNSSYSSQYNQSGNSNSNQGFTFPKIPSLEIVGSGNISIFDNSKNDGNREQQNNQAGFQSGQSGSSNNFQPQNQYGNQNYNQGGQYGNQQKYTGNLNYGNTQGNQYGNQGYPNNNPNTPIGTLRQDGYPNSNNQYGSNQGNPNQGYPNMNQGYQNNMQGYPNAGAPYSGYPNNQQGFGQQQNQYGGGAPRGQLGLADELTISETVQNSINRGERIYPLDMGPGAINDYSRVNSPTLPPSQAKWFINGEVIDGMNATCDNRRPRRPSRIGRQALEQVARAAFTNNQGLCKRGNRGPPPPGQFGPPPGGAPPPGGVLGAFGKTREQELETLQRCKTKPDVGTCGEIDRSAMVESIYIMLDMGNNLLIATNGIPGHCYTRGNDGGLACENFAAMMIPKQPRYTGQFRPWPDEHHQLGITVAGSFLSFHAFGGDLVGKCNVVNPIQKYTYGPCDGHASPECIYHIHKAPVCMPGFDSCGLMGHYYDGFQIHGKCTLVLNGRQQRLKSCYRLLPGKNGCDETHYEYRPGPDCNLDQANGMLFQQEARSLDGGIRFTPGQYAYFFTSEYPFMSPGTFGEPQTWCNFPAQDAMQFLNQNQNQNQFG